MFDAPVPEVSGVCFVNGRVVVVGDAEPVVGWADWTAHGPGDWSTVNVAELPGAPTHTGQFEAVEHVADDVVAVLCEDPAMLVAVDLRAGEVVGSWNLEVDLKGLRKRWRKDSNSRGEGLVFGRDRVYVVKEKKPPAIIEFGVPDQAPLGAVRPDRWQPPTQPRLVALGFRRLEGSDVSDATVVDGAVWMLSDQDRCIIAPDGRRIDLPGVEKPEGLARTPQGDWLVVSDDGDGRGALHLVPQP